MASLSSMVIGRSRRRSVSSTGCCAKNRERSSATRLIMEDSINGIRNALAFAYFVLAERRFEFHSTPFDNTNGFHISGIARGLDSVHAHLLEGEPNDLPDCLRHIAFSPI